MSVSTLRHALVLSCCPTKQLALLILIVVASTSVWAQDRTITSAGNWSSTSIWQSNLVADQLGENAIMSNSLGGSGVVTVNANFTIGNLNTGDNNDLIVDDNFTLSVGQSGSARNLTVWKQYSYNRRSQWKPYCMG